MKDYDLKKVLYYVKEEERKSKAIERMINHLLPSNVQELNHFIAINRMLDQDNI